MMMMNKDENLLKNFNSFVYSDVLLTVPETILVFAPRLMDLLTIVVKP
jgi:hypothetical protein